MQDEPVQIISPLEVKTQDGVRIETFLDSPLFNGFQNYHSSGSFGNMSFHHYAGSGFNIWYSEYNMNGYTKLHARADVPFLELHIPFEKHIISVWDGYYYSPHREKQYDISFAPYVDTVSEFPGDKRYSTFDIHYEKSYLRRFDYVPAIASFLKQVENNKCTNLIGEPKFLTPAMISLVNRTLYHPIDPLLAPLYHESNVLMMLTLLLDQLMQKNIHNFSDFDRECALHTRDLITKDFTTVYSIHQLCRLTGTNELKLQHCFRDMFGTTIFDYHQSLRLEHARQLLSQTSKSIQDIAFECGYSDNSNLTAAFKKKFGYTPDSFRKNR